MKSKIMLVLLSVMLILSLTACTEKADPAHDPSEVIVKVNDVEITYGEFDDTYLETIAYYEASGEEVSEELILQLKNDVLDYLISNEVLKQAANSDDYETSEEDAAVLYENFVARYEDEAAYQVAITEQGLTDEEVKSELINQDNVDYFLNTYAEEHDLLSGIYVTEQEVEDTFLQYVLETGQDDITLDEMHDYIVSQLQEQKTSNVVGDIVDALEEEATIEYLIIFE